MPGLVERGSPQLPPKVYISKPTDLAALVADAENLDTTGRRAWKVQEHTRTRPSEWEDVDERPPRQKRKKSKRSSTEKPKTKRSTGTGGAGRFFSNLSQKLESGESVVASRSSHTTRAPESGRKQRQKDSTRSSKHGENSSISHRCAARHRSLGLQRRHESGLRINPSLLSVLSTMTGSSGNSGGSGSTITQSSFDRRNSKDSAKPPTNRQRRADSAIGEVIEEATRTLSPNVFDFMQAPSINDTHDGQSVISLSSSASRCEPSEGGSSEAPTTPSSYTTFSSPGSTRRTSVAELRQRYDPQYTGSPQSPSARTTSRSPDHYPRTARKQPSVSDVPEVDEQKLDSPVVQPELLQEGDIRSSSRSSRSRSTSQRLRDREESLRRHVAHTQQPHHQYYTDHMHAQHRSVPQSSAASDTYNYTTALQQYKHAPITLHPAQPIPPLNETDQTLHRPPAPDAPDPTRNTPTGYARLATHLTDPTTPLKPLYRKFTHLNHRILLHLQDELSELEDQLRHLDGLIAHYDNGQPASRRAETYNGHELHHRRRNLLGCVFLKTEQYHRAMVAFMKMEKQGSVADGESVRIYRAWLEEQRVVQEVETRFLDYVEDLIDLGGCGGFAGSAMKEERGVEMGLPLLVVPFMVPLLLFPVIPGLAGRLLVVALVAFGTAVFVAMSKLTGLMSLREWVLCGGAYLVLMALVGVLA